MDGGRAPCQGARRRRMEFPDRLVADFVDFGHFSEGGSAKFAALVAAVIAVNCVP